MPPVSPTFNVRIIGALVLLIVVLLYLLLREDLGEWWHTAPVVFETIEEGSHGIFSERKNFVIKSGNEWHDLWGEIHQNGSVSLPDIDFSTQMVLALFQGQKPSGGYSIAVDRVTDSGGAVTVSILESEPGSGCRVTEALTTPYYLLKLKRFDGPIVSTLERIVVPCES